jgi:hypothetical protein
MAMIKRLYDEMHDEVTAVVQESWDNAVGEVDNIRNDAISKAEDMIYEMGREHGLDADDIEWLFKGSEFETIHDFITEQFDHCWDL